MRGKAVVVLVLMMVFKPCITEAKSVYLSVAASMTDVFKEIVTEFRIRNPENSIFPNFASSGSLAKQIDQGAPADVYVSANPKWMSYLQERKMMDEDAVRIFAHNTLVFVGGENIHPQKMTDLLVMKRIAIGTPASVPAGQYAKQAMEAVHIYSKLEQGRKLVMAKDVRQALLYADRGEVDGAFVYLTDAILVKQAKIHFSVPDGLHDRVSYVMGLTISGVKNDSAIRFYDFMKGKEVIAILKKHGFEPAQEN